MIDQEILDNAPEGSTHIDEDGTYFKRTYGQAYCWVNKSTWMTANKSRAMRSLADIKRIIDLEGVASLAKNNVASEQLLEEQE